MKRPTYRTSTLIGSMALSLTLFASTGCGGGEEPAAPAEPAGGAEQADAPKPGPKPTPTAEQPPADKPVATRPAEEKSHESKSTTDSLTGRTLNVDKAAATKTTEPIKPQAAAPKPEPTPEPIAPSEPAAPEPLPVTEAWHVGNPAHTVLMGEAMIDLKTKKRYRIDSQMLVKPDWSVYTVKHRPDLALACNIDLDSPSGMDGGITNSRASFFLYQYQPGGRATYDQMVRTGTLSRDVGATAMLTDMRTVLFFKDKMLHKAAYNWEAGKLEDAKPITKPDAISGMPFAVTNKAAVVRAEYDGTYYRAARIDMKTGEVQQLPPQAPFPNPDSRKWEIDASPTGSYVYRLNRNTIDAMDVSAGEFKSIPTTLKFFADGELKEEPDYIGNEKWLTDHKLFFAVPHKGVCAVVDMKAGRLDQLCGAAEPFQFERATLTPGKKAVHLTTEDGKHLVLDIGTKQLNETDILPKLDITWLDDRFAHYTTPAAAKGGAGFYIYDRQTNRSARVSDSAAVFAYLENIKTAVLSINEQTHLLDLSTGKAQPMGIEVRRPVVFAQELDLGFARPASSVTAVGRTLEVGEGFTIDKNSSPKTEADAPADKPAIDAGDPDETSQEKLARVLNSLENDAIRKEAEQVLQRYASPYYDASVLTLMFIDARKADPVTVRRNLMSSLDWRPAISREGIITVVTRDYKIMARDFPDPELAIKWIAERAYDTVVASHPETGGMHLNVLSNAIIKATFEGKDLVKAGKPLEIKSEPEAE